MHIQHTRDKYERKYMVYVFGISVHNPAEWPKYIKITEYANQKNSTNNLSSDLYLWILEGTPKNIQSTHSLGKSGSICAFMLIFV